MMARSKPISYCADPYAYRRRPSREVMVGQVGVGAANPIVIQSMTTTRTQDLEATLAQVLRLVETGCEIVRITAPTAQDARAIGAVRSELRRRGIRVPLVADIHFSPEAAMEAAEHAEKVRVNPGNYADARRFVIREYTDEQYAAELARVEQRFTPLVLKCKRLKVAMRVGTNHGSLSDRITNRYGDTPLGMVESALEFLRLCAKHDYHDVILSMKASNPKIMIQANRLLAAAMEREGMDYPLHLGVTEAGNGEDGRIKSAIGIGSLLDDGIGDTIRVSLTEEPEAEVPAAFSLAAPYHQLVWTGPQAPKDGAEWADPYQYERRHTASVHLADLAVGSGQLVRVVAASDPGGWLLAEPNEAGDGLQFLRASVAPVELTGDDFVQVAERVLDASSEASSGQGELPILAISMPDVSRTIRAYRWLASRLSATKGASPLHLVFDASGLSRDQLLLRCATALGSLLCDGLGDSVEIRGFGTPAERARLAYAILQGAGVRLTRTEFVACPGCGRTLFDLQATTDRIKERTNHLAGLKIAVMGCVVNGPGEMADADFGYVGGAPGKVNLYVGKELIERNVPEDDAEERLVALIKRAGRWTEPAKEPTTSG